MASEVLDERSLRMLRWRARRGLLENDIFIERFFERHGAGLTVAQGEAVNALMNLSDNDLLDLLLRRREPEAEMDTREIREVLTMMRPAPTSSMKPQEH